MRNLNLLRGTFGGLLPPKPPTKGLRPPDTSRRKNLVGKPGGVKHGHLFQGEAGNSQFAMLSYYRWSRAPGGRLPGGVWGSAPELYSLRATYKLFECMKKRQIPDGGQT